MRIILFVSLVFLLGSCNMQRWCAERYPPQTETITEYKDTIIYRDSIIFVPIPPDTISQKDTVYIEEGIAQMDKIRVDTDLAFAEAEIIDSQHYLWLEHKEAEIDALLEKAITEKTRTVTVTKHITVPEHYTTWWDEFWIKMGKIFSAAFGLIIGLIIFKSKIPFI